MGRRPAKNLRIASIYSTAVVNMTRAVRELRATLDNQGDTVAPDLEKRFEEVLEPGEVMPDMNLFFRLLSRIVVLSGEKLFDVETDRLGDETSLRVLRRERRQARRELYDAAVSVRKDLVSLFGSKPSRRRFALSESTPQGTDKLIGEVRTLMSLLDNPEFELPEYRAPAIRADRKTWVKQLREPLDRLRKLPVRRRRLRPVLGPPGRLSWVRSAVIGLLDALETGADRFSEGLSTLREKMEAPWPDQGENEA